MVGYQTALHPVIPIGCGLDSVSTCEMPLYYNRLRKTFATTHVDSGEHDSSGRPQWRL